MSDAEVEVKFRSLVGEMLPAASSDALLKQLWNSMNSRISVI